MASEFDELIQQLKLGPNGAGPIAQGAAGIDRPSAAIFLHESPQQKSRRHGEGAWPAESSSIATPHAE